MAIRPDPGSLLQVPERGQAWRCVMDATWLDRSPLFLQRRRMTQELVTHGCGVEFIDLPQAIVRVRVEGQGRPTVVFVADPPNVVEHYDTLFELLSPWARVACF